MATRVPDRIPAPAARRRFIDWFAPRMPFGHDRLYLTLRVKVRDMGGSVQQAIPYLMLVVGWAWIPLMRLPGSKLVELHDPLSDPWLQTRGQQFQEEEYE